ncbi:hypothetical protein [Acetobacter oeni]|uniref:hypothetical protein n=1 Tax=Acetobacter oeni TaxID=304077 RepID=UPI001797E42B|nr:hypothetical protein [Acetobacter oeni]MBB3881388.1 hypothetical protein [Acetobacter oeni]
MTGLISAGTISPLRQRLIDDMTMRGFSRETQRDHIRDVGRFATFPGRSPLCRACRGLNYRFHDECICFVDELWRVIAVRRCGSTVSAVMKVSG